MSKSSGMKSRLLIRLIKSLKSACHQRQSNHNDESNKPATAEKHKMYNEGKANGYYEVTQMLDDILSDCETQ